MSLIKRNKRLAFLGIVVLTYLLLLIPLYYIGQQNRQETRGRAQNENYSNANTNPPLSCGNVPTDIMLIIDRSGSMTGTNKLLEAKLAAKKFVDVIAQDTRNRIGLVSFSTKETLDIGLTNNYAQVKTKIDLLAANGWTCHECAVAKANQEIATNGRPGIKKVVVMLTDGQANYVIGGTQKSDIAVAEAKALAAITNGFNVSKTAVFTIGFGDEGKVGNDGYNGELLRKFAALTGGKYYYPAPGELDSVYQEISQLIGKGLLGGFVYNDINGNGIYDQGEAKLSGWKIDLVSGTVNKTVLTDASGYFTLIGLCDGAYSLRLQQVSGWKQTSPANTDGYPISISNGSQYTDKNFGIMKVSRCNDGIDNDNNGAADINDSSCHTDGNPKNPGSFDKNKDGEKGGGNTCADSKDNNNNGLIDGGDPVCHTDKNANNPGTYDPNLPEISPATPIPTPGNTSISVKVLLDGIGNRGDNTNPNASTLSNKNPKHKTKNAVIQVYNIDNKLISSNSGIITYVNNDGNFQGKISLGSSLTSGSYYFKIKTERYLRKLITGIQTITAGKDNVLPVVAQVTGDIDNDNKLNILDYNLLLDCYSDLAEAVDCKSAYKKNETDINDDGLCNQIDYNLFLREIATQPGE